MAEFVFEEEDFTTKFDSKTILRILSQARPHWKWLLGFLLTISLVSLIDSYFTFLSKRIIDEGILGNNRNVLEAIITEYGFLIIIQAAFVFGFIYLAGILGERIRYDLRKNLFTHLQALTLSYFDRTPVGWIMSRVTSDSDRVAELITWGLLDVTWGLMNILTAAYFMLIINWRLALIVFLLIPVLVFVAGQFKKRIIKEYRLVRKLNSKITGAFNENITGVRIVKAFRREEQNKFEFSSLSSEMYRAGFKAAWLSALFLPVVQIISSLALGSIIWYGGYQFQLGTLTIGGIQAFVSYVVFMLWPIQEMARVYAEMQNAIASAERIFSLIDSVPDISDQPTAKLIDGSIGDIEFDHVHFYYQGDNPVLSDFNLKVKQGETIAFVGPTGGGKTTIINLLCRFYEPTRGRILFGCQDYRDYKLDEIHSRIGMVLQTPHLFSGSIRENIRYGRLNATDDEIINASVLVGADEFISEFDNGYDEDVGEGGNLLSVGQKQLISLARAILREPEIIIMDEATSSVDTLTESLIQKGMDTIMKSRTSFLIAHRLSTINKADRILVINGGQISEMGTHDELLSRRGEYYNLYTQQFRFELDQAFPAFGLARV